MKNSKINNSIKTIFLKIDNNILQLIFLLSIFIYFLAALLVVVPTLAQTTKIDYLKTDLSEAKDDTNKVNILNTLAWELSTSNPDTSILLSTKALRLAEKLPSFSRKELGLGWQFGISNSYRNLGWFNWLKGNYDQALSYLSKAIEIFSMLNKEYPDDIRFKKGISSTLSNLGSVYYIQGDYFKTLEYYFKALKIDEELGDESGISKHLGNIGNVYGDKADYSQALEFYFKALVIDKKLGNMSKISSNLSNIGIVYRDLGDYSNTLKYYFKALEMCKKSGNKSAILTNLLNIGVVYQDQGDYPKALKYYSMSLQLAEEVDDKRAVAINLGNIGASYGALGNYQKSLEHLLKALEIDKELGYKDQIQICLGNIGTTYYELDNYPMAMDHFFIALGIAKELGNISGIAKHSGRIGVLYMNQKQHVLAEDYLNRSLSMAEKIGSMDNIKNAHKNLGILYFTAPFQSTVVGRSKGTETGKYALAFEHFEKYLQAKDTLFNEEKSETMGKMEARHEFAMADIERERKEKEAAVVVATELKRRNTVQYSIIVMVLILMVSFVLVFSKLEIPAKIKIASVFITFLLLFEFILVIADPFIEKNIGGSPVLKLAINAVLAIFIFPIQNWIVNKLSDGKLHSVAINTNNSTERIIILFFLLSGFSFINSGISSFQKNENNDTLTLRNQRPAISKQTPVKKITQDSLKALLHLYENQIKEFRSNNKQKEAYETIKKFGDLKDTLQQMEKTQEFSRINAKHALEKQQAEEKIKADEMKKKEATARARKNNLQYSGILIFIVFLFIALITFATKRIGKIVIPHRFLEGGLFVSFLLLFEFILVLTEPFVEQYTGGAPAWKLCVNMMIAICIFPVHHFLEEKLRERLFSAKRQMVEKRTTMTNKQ